LLELFATGLLNAAAPITAGVLSPDGRSVVLGSQEGIEIRSWPDLKAMQRLETKLIHVNDLAFSPDGQTLLAAGGQPAEQGAVEVYSWPDRKALQEITPHADLVYRVAWSPNGQEWATASADGTCGTFRATTGEQRVRYEGHSRAVLDVVYLSAGSRIASAGADQTLQIWEPFNAKLERSLDNHVGTINALAPRPGGFALEMIATVGEDRTVRFWQPTIGRMVRFLKLPSIPRALAWSANGQVVYVGCNDGRIRTINGENAEVISEVEGLEGNIYELVVDSINHRILVCGETGVRSLSVQAGQLKM
jgi:WD40 repeat protein